MSARIRPFVSTDDTTYDAIVVGSGAGGGMATWRLAQAGLRVALVEAGPWYDPAHDSQRTQFRYPWESPRRGASTRLRPFGDFNACIGGWELDGEPFTTAEGTDFMWWRARMLGGRTNHWGRISL
ncbi:MAG: GMC family oxidoreductase, partial [Gammaproteobacteria bacterium]|nr:GMC family oxidoreductase [Gammaproteobacteria bacterium]